VTLAFQGPTINEFIYRPIWTIGGMEVTFPIIVMFGVSILIGLFFYTAMRKPKLVPVGAQNVAEAGVDFVRDQIVLPVIGPEGTTWTPFLTTMFFWVFFNNIMAIIPGIQFPATSRMALPATLAALSWIIFNAIGIREQGFFGYFKGMLFPPGVPKPIYILLTPIELFSTIIVRPLTLAVRLFANMVAGHFLLTVLFLGTAVFFQSGLGKVTFVLPFAMGIIFTGFEVFVAGMQAFIITILTAVYIAGAMHPEH
jgi:F-type H+-transporting ATPase subunit a